LGSRTRLGAAGTAHLLAVMARLEGSRLVDTSLPEGSRLVDTSLPEGSRLVDTSLLEGTNRLADTAALPVTPAALPVVRWPLPAVAHP